MLDATHAILTHLVLCFKGMVNVVQAYGHAHRLLGLFMCH
jgi:hypothetical protein